MAVAPRGALVAADEEWRVDESGRRRFLGSPRFGGFAFIPAGAMTDAELASLPADLTAVLADYEAAPRAHAALKETQLPPLLLQLGHEASLLCVCVLRKYVFAPEPPSGSLSLAVLQSLLNLVMEYVPAYVEKVYWLEKTQVSDPTVKLYLASLLRAFDLFLVDVASILAACQKKNARFRSESMQHQRAALYHGFKHFLKTRNCGIIHDHSLEPDPSALRRAKVKRVKLLYSARLQSMFGDVKQWQAGLWMSSTVKSVAPLIVTVLDRYVTPYFIAVVFDRMLGVLISNAEAIAPKEVVEEVHRPHGKVDGQAFGRTVYTSVPEEERISSMYGALISSITQSLLSVVEITGLFRVVLQAVAKPLRLIFEKSLGAALSLALESSPEDDLKKVRFAMTMLFGDEVAAASSMHQHHHTGGGGGGGGGGDGGGGGAPAETVEDLLSSAFDTTTLDDLTTLLSKTPLQFEEDPQQQEAFVKSFYEERCVAALERVLLLELAKKSKALVRMSGDYVRQLLTSLVATLALVLRDPVLLDVLAWDYILPHLMGAPQ